MTAPCDPESAQEAREEEPEIILRLSDILPRVPVHLLKPGPHDTMAQVRFSVDELAEKIARGRVSVPLDRLASACPDVFLDSSAFPGEQEIPLPLQKLLDHIGLAAPKASSPNGMPREQLAQARAEAGRILNTVGAPSRATSPEPAAAESPASPPGATLGIGKVLSSARHFLGRLVPTTEPEAEAPAADTPEPVNTPVAEIQSPQPVPENPPETLRPAPPEAAAEVKLETPVEPANPPVPPGSISMHVLPIFRLLSSQALRSGTLPPEKQRIVLPLSLIDPQLAGGHVEIPVEDFVKALPEGLRHAINPIPGSRVWIPLDEIFQNLPTDHLFYMPPLDPPTETAGARSEEAALQPTGAEAALEHQAAPPAVPAAAPLAKSAQEIAGKPESEPAPAEPVSSETPPAGIVAPPEPARVAMEPVSERVAPPVPVESVSTPSETGPIKASHNAGPPAVIADAPVEALSTRPAVEETPPAPEAVVEPASLEREPAPSESRSARPAQEARPAAGIADASPEAISAPPSVESAAPAPEATAPASPAEPAESRPAETAPPAIEEPGTPPPPPRAPWMRGFQIPPPHLFSSSMTPAVAPPQPAQAEPPPAPAATPEAKKTVDFIASQPGIFASAAFVQGAVFASEDFPRKPDLDALREFMGVFIDGARESGRRLAWNRVLSMTCDQFHLTAVVRDTHFIVALHHDRVLNTVTYDALLAAAEDLSKAAG